MIKLKDTKWRRLTKLLCDLRERSDFTADEIARRVGVSPTSLRRWETGRINPPLNSFIAWADAMDCDVVLRPRRQKRLIGE